MFAAIRAALRATRIWFLNLLQKPIANPRFEGETNGQRLRREARRARNYQILRDLHG
jgi:hypothetical protein